MVKDSKAAPEAMELSPNGTANKAEDAAEETMAGTELVKHVAEKKVEKPAEAGGRGSNRDGGTSLLANGGMTAETMPVAV
jgi:hypothetical protein